MATVVVFIVAAALVLRLVSIHDYVEDVNGAIITDIRPTRLMSEDQYLIAKVYRQLGQDVRRGEPLVQLDGSRQRVALVKLEQSLQARRSELEYNRKRLDGIDRKLALNTQIILRKKRLASIEASHTRMAVALDAKRKKAARELRVLSEEIIDRIIPALDTQALSEIEKARVLSTANSDLRQMYQFAAEVQANQRKSERDSMLLQIEVAELEAEQVNLELARADISRALAALQGEIESLEQERAQITDQLTRLLVRSPVDGSIVRVSPNLLDSNLVERNEELFLIQPQGSRLEAELVLTDEQFRDARVGQDVNLELYAWNHYKHGTIRGEIVSISSSKIMPQVFQAKAPHFIAKVRISPGQDLQLRPGYNLKARILLGKISLFDYILKKIRVQ